MFQTESRDGTTVIGFDEGEGPLILVLSPGSDDGSSWAKVAEHLSARFRVVRIHRRQYRMDLDAGAGFPLSVEVEDAVATAEKVGLPVLIVGHSSGAVVALEALVVSHHLFTGAVLYEPPATIETGSWDEPLERASAAIAQGRPGKAMTIFARDIVKTPAWVASLGGVLVGMIQRYRELAPRQIFDAKAIYDLGIRLDAYSTIETPTLLLSGERSPKHLGERVDALVAVMPHAEKVLLERQGHTANKAAPAELAALIEKFYERLLSA